MTDQPGDRAQNVTDNGDRLFEQVLAGPAGTLLALDFDGTLAAIVPEPEDARMHPASRKALARLASRLGTVAIITGRQARTVVRLGELDDLFRGQRNVLVLGQYGVERWDAATGRITEPPLPPAIGQAIGEISALLDDLGADQDLVGVRVEDKGRAVGVHTRQAADPQRAWSLLAPHLDELADRLGLTVEPGRNVIELRASRITKGDALTDLAERVGARVLIMAGDDLGDVHAFKVVRAWQDSGRPGAVVVSLSAEEPAVRTWADVVCQGPDGVAQWLTRLADRLDEESGPRR